MKLHGALKRLILSLAVGMFLLIALPLVAGASNFPAPPEGSWAAFPNSTLRPAMGDAPWNPIYIFDYSGGWFDEDRDELGIWGGGHGDYPGNEVCTFPLSTGVWTCGPRSAYVDDPTTETTADGNPSARHTYYCIARVNVPGYDGFFCHGGSLWRLGYPTAATWFYHRDTTTWERLADRPNWGDSDYGKTSLATYAVFDKVRNKVLVRGRNMCMSFDMGTKAWEWQGSCLWSERTASAAFDPERQTFIVIGAGIFEAWSTATTPWTPLSPYPSGDQAPVAAGGPGFVFDPLGKRYLAYIGGKDLYEFNRDTWAFTKITGAGADPGAQFPDGTFGRFRYVPSMNGLVVTNSIDSNVFYFQLSGTPSDTIPPTASITSPLSSATVSGRITVSADAIDNVGVAGVQFKLDGANLGAEDTLSPYSVSWDTTTATNGPHTLSAVARDQAGNTGTASNVNVTVSNPVPDTTPPSVPTHLAATAVSSSQINLSWTASTDNVAVTGYKIYRAGTQIATVTSGPAYQDTGLSPSTRYTYTVSAYDAAGNNSAQSASVSATTFASTQKFQVGDRVFVTAKKLNVKATPNGKNIGFQAQGAQGTVIGGPMVVNGVIWWNINYDVAPDGWSEQDSLEK